MTSRIHQVLQQFGALALPGVYDTLSAKIAQSVGFPMGFVSGYSVAATSIGEPDLVWGQSAVSRFGLPRRGDGCMVGAWRDLCESSLPVPCTT